MRAELIFYLYYHIKYGENNQCLNENYFILRISLFLLTRGRVLGIIRTVSFKIGKNILFKIEGGVADA